MKARLNVKYVVFSVIAMMIAYVLYHNERFLIEPTNPLWQHYAPFKWWLLPHGIFGAVVILLAPLQFSDRLRRRFTRSHRVVGRLYVAGVFLLAPLGAYIQYYQERLGSPRSFTVLAVVNAVMLIAATAIAFLFAYKRKITQHRQWIVRSYAIALVFIEGRFIMGITGWEELGVEIVQAIIWSCLAMSVLLGDLANHWTEIVSALSAPARSSVPTKQNLPDGAVETASSLPRFH
ncbi:MAG TPA: DUF2306 domain-containing protein [Blastocatellia bacterium]|nr:DUF2306 domain-containing protein [Blastocatellia bacterium]